MSIVCGDSHTSTHGALGALAFGIGTSEVEHVLVTGCLWQSRLKNFKIEVNGELNKHVNAKDVALYIIGKIGTASGTGYVIEFSGNTIENLSIEGRMTLCNMTIEAGSRCSIIAVDDKTFDYVKERPFTPINKNWDKAIKYWNTLHSDDGVYFDKILSFKASDIKLQVTWGTSPEMVISIDGITPDPSIELDPIKAQSIKNALNYIHLAPNIAINSVRIDKIFISSCSNSRIED